MAEARIALHTATLKQYEAINDDDTLVDVRTLVRLHPEYNQETLELIAATKKKLKQARDDLAKKRKLDSDPGLAAKAKQQEAARKKRAKDKETPEEYELRRERERVNEAKSRAAVQADPVRAAQRAEALHVYHDTDEYRAKKRERYAADIDHYRTQALQYYQKQKEEGRVPVPNFDVQAARQRAAQNQRLKPEYAARLVFQSGRTNNVAVNMTETQIIETTKQPCYYCGTTTERIGLDRKDSNGVYELTNVLPCCATCNMMKGGHTPEVFIERCRDVTLHQTNPSYIATVSAPHKIATYNVWRQKCESKGIVINMSPDERTAILRCACIFCGADNHTIDRISTDGDYSVANTQPCCLYCNMSKRETNNAGYIARCQLISVRHPIDVVSSSAVWQCQLCYGTTNRCYSTQECADCYYHTHFKKNRSALKDRECYNTVLAKDCELCGQHKSLKAFIEPSCTVCLVCQSGDDY